MTDRDRPWADGIPKLAPPDPGDAIDRPRLSRRLEVAWARRLGWISGPAGAGKTTLVAEWARRAEITTLWYRLDRGDSDPATFFHYLAAACPASDAASPLPVFGAEYLLDLPTFARRWIERFGERLAGPTLLVLDDYQHVEDESALHTMLAAAVEAAPASLGVLFVSRRPPPSAFVRLRTHGALELIDDEALRLTDDEARDLARARLVEAPDDAWLTRLNATVEGWCAGLRLLLELGSDRRHDEAVSESGRRVFFDYFAVEVFDRIPAPLQRFMVETSVVPELSPRVAERLTGRADAVDVLHRVVERGLFTTRLGVDGFRYHALFRDFLRGRLDQILGEEERARHITRAATLLAEEGDVDAAVELLFEAKAWARAAALVREHAPRLLATGRSGTLSRWLGRLPRSVGAKDAWIAYWRGMANAHQAPAEAISELEHAFEQHQASGDRAGELITLAGICETISLARDTFLPLDRWLAEVDRRLDDGGFPSPELAARCVPAFFAAASHRCPDHPRVPEWERQLQMMVPGIPDRDQRALATAILVNHLTWTGRTAAAMTLLDSLRDALEPIERCAPRTQILFLLLSSITTWQDGDTERAARLIDRALEVGRHEGVRAFDSTVAEGGCYALLGADDPDGAERYLLQNPDPLPQRTANRSARLQLHALVHLRRGELAAAAAHLEMAEQLGEQAGAVIFHALLHTAAAHLALARDDRDTLALRVDALRTLARRVGYRQFEAECALLEAIVSDEERRERDRLAEAFRIQRELGSTLHPWWSKAAKASLCARALRYGIETEYVRDIVRRQSLTESPPADADASWPWRLEVRTLGAFEIDVRGEPLELGKKVPRRPLELLGALVALGGEASTDELSLTLFPDNEGDAAAAALKTTIARLRKLVGADAIVVRASVVSLSPSHVWADAVALTQAMERGGDEAPAAVERWYRGDFLPHHDLSWVLTARGKLRRRATRVLLQRARRELEEDRVAEAISQLERCLRISPSSESAYRSLMRCHAMRGSTEEITRTFERCRQRVLESGALELAEETVELYERLRAEVS